jgi:hypothetical protein
MTDTNPAALPNDSVRPIAKTTLGPGITISTIEVSKKVIRAGSVGTSLFC